MKDRLDKILNDLSLVKSRTAAARLIKEGCVAVNGAIVKRSSEQFDSENDKFEINEQSELLRYVGRGGLKLEKAIEDFSIALNGKICMDIGASTGGFTDCMLKNGAKRVYAVDVGHDQLDPSLRSDCRVISLEGLDIRNADEKIISEKIDFFSIDVSFISLKLIFPELKRFCAEKAECTALIKPQFEHGKHKNGKNGVIKDPKIHREIINDMRAFAEASGFHEIAVIPSPIKGGDGNTEFLMHFFIDLTEERQK